MRFYCQYRIPAIFFLVSGILAVACTNKPENGKSHTIALDSFYNSMKLADDTGFSKRVDSIYLTLGNASLTDQWTIYSYKFFLHYYRTRDYNKALLYADTMLALVEKKPDYKEQYARTLFYKGDAFLAQRRFSEAFSWYYKARIAIVDKKDSCALAEYSSRLANACYRQNKFTDAANYYKQSLQEEENCSIRNFHQFAEHQGNLDNIGICYVKANNKDSAALYYNKALDYISANEHWFPEQKDFMVMARAVIYGNQANIAMESKNYQEAEKLLKLSISINENPGHAPEDAVYSRIKLAKMYLAQGRNADAAIVIKKIDTARQAYINPELSEGFYLLRSKQAAAAGDHKTAYFYLAAYDGIRDSVATAFGPVTSLDIQQALDDIARQYQLVVLEKENKTKSDYLILLIVIVVLAVLVVSLVLMNYQRSRKNVAELTQLHEEVTHKNAALQQTLTALEHGHQNNNRFMRIVAHDLRGPIGAITSLVEILKAGDIAAEKQPEALQAIHTSATKSLSLINELLTDMQAFGELSNIETVNIADILKYCVALYDHQVQEKNQTVTLDTEPAYVSADQEKLWRVFSNLISNAIKFSKRNGGIRISMETTDNEVTIAIHDEGIGIPDNFKHKIFESTGVGSPGTSGEASFGLGLSISKQIISLHHGRIWFESKTGEGASFFVSLPLAKQSVS
jgi:signal transduction histidine kinase